MTRPPASRTRENIRRSGESLSPTKHTVKTTLTKAENKQHGTKQESLDPSPSRTGEKGRLPGKPPSLRHLCTPRWLVDQRRATLPTGATRSSTSRWWPALTSNDTASPLLRAPGVVAVPLFGAAQAAKKGAPPPHKELSKEGSLWWCLSLGRGVEANIADTNLSSTWAKPQTFSPPHLRI